MTLTMDLPPLDDASATVPLLELALNIVDVIGGSSLPYETVNKLVSTACDCRCQSGADALLSIQRKRRTEVHSLLLLESRKEAKEKKEAEIRAIKKASEDAKKEKMSLAERRKYEAKQKEKDMMKMAQKQAKK